MPFMSRELVFCIPAGPNDPKPSEIQLLFNEGTIILLQFSISELWFVVGAQSFPLHHRRKCDYLLERATTIMKMLSFRPNISAEHFMEDQKILGDLIVEFQTEISVEYKRLYTFLLLVEEQNAFEGFRCLFNLQDVVAKEDDKEADEVRKVNGFIRRRYSWVGSGEQSWLHKATTFYHSWEYIRDPMKNRILQRYR